MKGRPPVTTQSERQQLTEYKSRQSYAIRNKRRAKNKSNIVNRSYPCKYLSKKCNCYMPDNMIRMLEYNVPTQNELHPSNNDTDRHSFSYFWSQINYKRIVQYEYIPSAHVYHFDFEERWSKKSSGNELKQFFQGCNYLRTFTDKDTMEQSKKMEQLLNFVNNCAIQAEALKKIGDSVKDSKTNIIKKLVPKDDENKIVRLVPKKDDSFRKTYHIKFEKETSSSLKKVPYLCLIEEFNTNKSELEIKSYKFNRLFLEYLGITHVNQTSAYEGFEQLSRVQSQNWVLFFNTLIDFKLNENLTTQHLVKEAQHCETRDKKILKGTFNMYKQVYQYKNSLTQEIYFALNGEEP